ncbi:MAG: DUF2063 domain-containing protein [Rhodospirillales bacterium 12-54-5]|nr:MAG: DUF2063 domain-containing protein [Rhodospirillales bacterium 12-54-5]
MTQQKTSEYFPQLGFGLGLRVPHYVHIFEHWPTVDWFEIISENFMDTDGKARRNLARIAERYPIVMHGIALSIGTVDPLNSDYLAKLKKLIDDVKPAWISDHLCWTGIAHKNSHDLLPVPYTEEALKHIVSRIQQVQDYLGRPIALENPSTYLEFKTSHIPEAEFIAEMAKQSGCHLLLDVNNVYVSCYNHRLDAKAYIDALPLDRVAQIHLSGHSNYGTHIIDTHDDHVIDDVWALYKYATHTAGRTINTMIEWDDNVPTFDVLFAELGKAKLAAADAANYAPLHDLAQANTPYTANRMTPLADAQTVMQQAILLGKTYDSRPDEWIRSKADFAPTEQLAVYVNAYRYRLYDVTAEDYPVLQHYLGDESFKALIWDFVNRVTSSHFNVGRYAAQLPAFLAQHPSGDAFACELAAMENAISQLTDPAETIPLSPEHLAGMTPEILMESVLHPRAALQLFAFEYPINSYYLAVKEEKQPAPPAPQKSYLVVFRHDDVVWRMDVEENEYRLLEKLFAGQPIGIALEALQSELDASDDQLVGELSHWFSRWMRNGLLAHYEYTDESHHRSIA